MLKIMLRTHCRMEKDNTISNSNSACEAGYPRKRLCCTLPEMATNRTYNP